MVITRGIVLTLLGCLVVTPAAWPGASAAELTQRLERLLEERELEEVHEEALALLGRIEAVAGPDSLDTANAIDLIVRKWWRKGIEASAARALAERAVAIKEALLGPQAPDVAASLENLGTMLMRAREFEEARSIYERVLAIRERALGREHADVASTLASMSHLAWWMMDVPESRRLCERSMEIAERALGPDHISLADCLGLLAAHLANAGRLAEGSKLNQRRLAIVEAHHGPEHWQVANVLNSLSLDASDAGDYPEAESLLRRSLAIMEKTLSADNPGLAMVNHNLGKALRDGGDYAAARLHVERALRIWEEASGPESPSVAVALETLGELLQLTGDYDAARVTLERGLAINEKRFGGEDQRVATALAALGSVAKEAGDYPRARALYERAAGILEGDPDARAPLAVVLRGSAEVAVLAGDEARAREALERALEIRVEFYESGHPYVAESLADLGRLHHRRGDHDAARPLYERALKIQETRLGPDHPEVAGTLHFMAALSLEQGDRRAARERAARVSEILNVHIRETLAFLPERQALLMVDAQLHPESLLFHGLLSAESDGKPWLQACWNWVLARRGIVLEELAARNRAALRAQSAGTREAWERLATARRRLGGLWVSGGGEMDRQQYGIIVRQARAEKEEAEAGLARRSAEFRRRGARRIDLARVRAALPARSALVEIVRVVAGLPFTDQRTHDVALILGPDGRARFADLGDSARIDRLVSDWRRELSDSIRRISDGPGVLAGMEDAGHRLRAALWDPLVPHLQDAQRVYLVPDGSLHRVDLAALPAAGGGFLIETGPHVRILSTGRDLTRRPQGPAGRGVLALGAPDFDAAPSVRMASLAKTPGGVVFRGQRPDCTALADHTWPALPGSGREVESIGSLWREKEPVTVLTGLQASEEQFKRLASGKRVLHLATHGYFVHGPCSSSGTRTGQDNPLLLSGLVLAGANRGDAGADGAEDGILTAEELAAVDLRSVQLAVLSACDTGRGEVAVGEGVFGLRRGLEVAGVRTVVMSLWPVPDRYASRWMTALYREQLAGASIHESARRSSLQALSYVREQGRPEHPYLWAGFVAAGE